jgi:hypothetical protein
LCDLFNLIRLRIFLAVRNIRPLSPLKAAYLPVLLQPNNTVTEDLPLNSYSVAFFKVKSKSRLVELCGATFEPITLSNS